MPKHTPGTWEKGKTGYGSPYYVYSDDATGSVIAACWHKHVRRGHDEMDANALLIAAAPDMLAALKTVGGVLSERFQNGKSSLRDDELWAAYSQVIAAISKAEG